MWKAAAAIGIVCIAWATHLLAQPEEETDQSNRTEQEAANEQVSGEQQSGEQDSGAQQTGEQERSQQIEHGRYIVHHVAHCVVCHTPRTERGELIERRLLRGAPIPVESPYPNMPWAFEAPQLAGLPGWTEEEITVLLRAGRRPNGYVPRPPMPTFRMNQEDAAAVAAYLASLQR